jgi:hypothetical protein
VRGNIKKKESVMELQKMYPPQKDSPSTYIAGDIGTEDIYFVVGNADVLPQTVPFPLTLGFDKSFTETVTVTDLGNGNNQLTVQRGETPFMWAAGTKCARVWTSGDMTAIQNNISVIAEQTEENISELSLETAARESADDTLREDLNGALTALGQETETRESADDTLRKDLNDALTELTQETAARESADDLFLDSLTTEIEARETHVNSDIASNIGAHGFRWNAAEEFFERWDADASSWQSLFIFSIQLQHNLGKYPLVQVMKVSYGAGVSGAGDYPAGGVNKSTQIRCTYDSKDTITLYFLETIDNPQMNKIDATTYVLSGDGDTSYQIFLFV